MTIPGQRHRYQTRVSPIPKMLWYHRRMVSDPSWSDTANGTDTFNNWYHPKDDDTRSETSVSDPSQSDTANALIPPKDVTPQNIFAADGRGATSPRHVYSNNCTRKAFRYHLYTCIQYQSYKAQTAISIIMVLKYNHYSVIRPKLGLTTLVHILS